MQFRTQIPIQKSNFPIDHSSKIVLLGSCFSENMFHQFDYFKFDVISNPFGIIFNTFSIENIIKRAIEKHYFVKEDLIFYNEIWQSLEIHSSMSRTTQDELTEQLNATLDSFHERLKSATHLFLTYGTSWVYSYKKSGQIVANCHKIPQDQFDKKLISQAENKYYIQNTLEVLKAFNINLKIIFTISPVRHIKDGMVENQVSKANLISAVNEVITQNPQNLYFPGYEIMMDDLRDYRFYAEDLLHPSQFAVKYIWEKLSDAFFDEKTCYLMKEIDSIRKSLAHRPLNSNTYNHQKFLKNLHNKIELLQAEIAGIRF